MAMVTISATEFTSNFEIYEEKSRSEPIAVTSHDRTSGYFVSPREFEEFQRIKAGSRRVLSVENLPSEISDGIRNARMDPSHDHLNALMDD